MFFRRRRKNTLRKITYAYVFAMMPDASTTFRIRVPVYPSGSGSGSGSQN